MSFWLADPELFLYAKGTSPDDVHLWRCKKPTSSSSSSSSLVVPMKFDDFDYVSNVKNHLELIGDLFDWDETDYKRLVKYIYEKRLLVNGQGFVIAGYLHKEGNKNIDGDANEEEEDVHAIYIRSLDVLALKPYIPKLRERPIPLRTVKYLGDVNGKDALMEQDPNVTKLTARVADLEAANMTLEGKVTMLIADLNRAWMNDLTNSEWVGIEGLYDRTHSVYDDFIIVGQQGTFTVDDSSTNVRARCWYKLKLYASDPDYYKAVFLEDLTPNKEMARFTWGTWYFFNFKGKAYVCRLV